ncbi:MAG TPA: chorismate-binding protein, partial [Allosphingosinicella sp.]|nr:chorismate-binding protein [Allosphingosinicella sp.]
MNAQAPFVLLDGDWGSETPRGRLYRAPAEIIETREASEVRSCLARLRNTPLHAAGFLAYEAGYALEPRLVRLCTRPPADAPPLLWFGLFEGFEEVEPEVLLPDPASGWAGAPEPSIGREAFESAVRDVQRHIEAGNVYQANLSFQAEVRTAGSPLAIYAAARARAQARHGAIVFTGEHWLLSFSPELFFTLERDRLTTRPMKG